MGCLPKTIGGTVLLWHFVVGIIALAASIAYNFDILDDQYADSPADTWLLVGGVTSSSASFRIRLASDGKPLTDSRNLVLSKEEDLLQIDSEYVLDSETAIDSSYGIHAVDATGLEPQTKYYYAVQSSYAATILTGSFQTPAPEGTVFNFTIATGACSFTGSRAYIYEMIREDHPDLQLFLHLGDFHYEDIDSSDMTERLDAVSTVLKSRPQAELFRSFPLAYTWDDHDYLGDNEPEKTVDPDVRDTALRSYQLAFPHYPLAAALATGNTTVVSPIPVYHAFTMGTVRFIISDLQSENSDASIYSAKQQDWLFQELQQADQYDFVILVSSKPWIGVETESNKESVYASWIGLENTNTRAELSSFISEAIGGVNGPQNLLIVAGDAHMVAFDDGTNTYYGSNLANATSNNEVYSFPILQSAPLDRLGSAKGGPFTDKCWALGYERTHQYSTLSFEFPPEDGTSNGNSSDSACIYIESYRVDEWFYKERLLSKRICGKFFQPAVPLELSESRKCAIDTLSNITVALLSVAVVISGILGGATCIIVMRDFALGNCARIIFGAFTVLVAWGMLTLTVSMGVLVPVLNDKPQFYLRINFIIAAAASLVMCCVLFIILCCCFRGRRGQEDAKPESIEFDTSGVDVPSTTDNTIVLPKVIRKATSKKVNEQKLPEGVILHGGEQLHKEGLSGKGIRVAVIDSGVDDKHSGFKGQVKKQVWLRSGTPLKEDDHGTHVAGTIHLMAPDAEIYDYRVFGKDGELSVDQAIAKAIRQAADSQCQVVNMSLGAPVPNNNIWDAIQYANNKGVVLVCAAGNEGDNNPLTNEISFPASYKECISVAAVSKANGFPVAVFSNSNPLVDYAGIGVDVNSFKPGGGYQIMSGTSMACPHVAGLIACLLTDGRNSPRTIRPTLNELAIDIDAVGFDNATGVGFVTYLNEKVFDEMLPRR